MSVLDWALANKLRSICSLIAALAAVVVLPISVVAWADELATAKAKEAELRMQGREEVIHGTQAATHTFDFYSIRAAQAEAELVALEEDIDAGVQLTASEARKVTRLVKQVETFNEEADKALEQLKSIEVEEHAHEEE